MGKSHGDRASLTIISQLKHAAERFACERQPGTAALGSDLALQVVGPPEIDELPWAVGDPLGAA